MENVTTLPKKIPKAAPRNWIQKELQVFIIAEHEYMIRDMSKGLEKEELLSYFGLVYSDLPSYDKFFFDVTFARGRIDQKHNAVLKLVESMNGNSALQSSLAYLQRFGNDIWKQDVKLASDKPSKVELIINTHD